MKLNENLNLVLPIGDRQAFHTPISREVFEENYRILAATKSAISSKGVYYQMDSGPRIAALALRDEAKREAEETGSDKDFSLALLAEIRRLTMILCPSANGYDMMPVDSAIASGKIDAEDWGEAEASIVFFTCLWSLSKKAERQKAATATAGLLKASITSSALGEYLASLRISMKEKTAQAAVSSDQSSDTSLPKGSENGQIETSKVSQTSASTVIAT